MTIAAGALIVLVSVTVPRRSTTSISKSTVSRVIRVTRVFRWMVTPASLAWRTAVHRRGSAIGRPSC